jgi:iron complex transport system substrate-binding protein
MPIHYFRSPTLDETEFALFESLTRRRFLIGAGALGLGVLTGCGAEDQADAPTATSVSDGYPRTVKHKAGETTFTSRPERVIAEGNFVEFDNLLALKIPIIARGSGQYDINDPLADLLPWQRAAGGEQVPLNQAIYGHEANLEELVRLKPDVYFIWDTNFSSAEDAGFKRRNKIVPIIPVPAGIDGLRVVADVFATPPDTVEAIIGEARSKMAAFKPARVPSSITAFFYFDDGNFYLASAQNDINEMVLKPLGLPTLRPQGDAAYPPFATISTELAAELDADLVLGLFDQNYGPALEQLEQHPLFQSIPAVRDGRYHRLSLEMTYALVRPTVLNVDTLLAGLTEVLST